MTNDKTKIDRYDLIAAIRNNPDRDKTIALLTMIGCGSTDRNVENDWTLLVNVLEGKFDNLDWRVVIESSSVVGGASIPTFPPLPSSWLTI